MNATHTNTVNMTLVFSGRRIQPPYWRPLQVDLLTTARRVSGPLERDGRAAGLSGCVKTV